MRRLALLCVLLALVVWGTTRLPSPRVVEASQKPRVSWTTVSPGVELRTFRTAQTSQDSSVTVTALRTDPSRIHVVGGATLDASGWRKGARAIAAVNGGYFDANGRSLGLRISRNKRTSMLHPADWGVFYVKGNAAHIVHTSQYKTLRDAGRTRRVLEAVQSGPRLIVDGKPTRLKPQWARRSGIGINRSGKVILAVADGQLSFAAWQRLWSSRQDLDCPNALNLDGGGSTQLSLQGKHPREVAGLWPVPDAIVIK